MADLKAEIEKRRAFAIIAHPDAGKTTLTEKLLLYGGAIQLAGHVRAKKNRKSTRSDWMKMEQDRGISVSTSAMQFGYKDHVLNLLDTPGHEDFSEDTYRTLMAVESAVMLLDAAKGVEPQTIKLFRICKERRIPIITFINKMDRPAKDPFELLDEVEEVLGITGAPIVWPLGSGPQFKGVYDLEKKLIHAYSRSDGGKHVAPAQVSGPDDPALKELLGDEIFESFQEEAALAAEVLPDFDAEKFAATEITPVFFGSALTNFGIEQLLDNFISLAPSPQPVVTETETINPEENRFTAFIFKLQANMNKAHRDRVAFARITSGEFSRGMQVTLPRAGKQVKLSSPVSFFGQDRNTIDTAFAGDIIGLINPKLYQIGDILCTGDPPSYRPLPKFAPEAFARIIPTDTSKLKAFKKGLSELAEEGVVQVFNAEESQPIIGGVGQLQFEVFKFRLEDEYNTACRLEALPHQCSRWINPDHVSKLSKLQKVFVRSKPTTDDSIRNRIPIALISKTKNPDIELFLHPPV